MITAVNKSMDSNLDQHCFLLDPDPPNADPNYYVNGSIILV